MPYLYSSKERERDLFKLPDIEVFYVDVRQIEQDRVTNSALWQDGSKPDITSPGWYWWACCPGCLPDGEPQGPYETEAEAIEASKDD